MRLSLGQQMQLAQKQVLAPRMIQSMEILQLPLMALQERIEQEMEDNPCLDQLEPVGADGHRSLSLVLGRAPVIGRGGPELIRILPLVRVAMLRVPPWKRRYTRFDRTLSRAGFRCSRATR